MRKKRGERARVSLQPAQCVHGSKHARLTGTSTPSSSAGSATLVLYTSAAILYSASSLIVLMFLAMKSVTGWILAGSAHPTHVTPVTGKARS